MSNFKSWKTALDQYPSSSLQLIQLPLKCRGVSILSLGGTHQQ